MNINDLLTSDRNDAEDIMTMTIPVRSPVDRVCDSIELLFSNIKNSKTISEDDFNSWTEQLNVVKLLNFGEIPERISDLIPLVNEKEVSDGSSS